MDTYKFMVRSPFTQEMFQETYWKRVLHVKRSRRNLVVQCIYLIAAFAFLVWAAYLSVQTSGFDYLSVLVIAAWIFYLYTVFGVANQAKIQSRKEYRTLTSALEQKEFFSTYKFYEDHFVLFTALEGSRNEVLYSKLSQINETENYFVIFTVSNRVFCVSKKVNAGGTDAEFAQFLHSLCPKS